MMAHYEFAEEEELSAMGSINITPLVDVVLVLLILFMIIIPAVIALAPLEMELAATPESAAAVITQPLDMDIPPLAFTIRRVKGESVLYLNGQPVAEGQLKDLVEDLLADAYEPKTTVAAEAEVPYSDVVRFVDKLIALELTQLTLETKAVSEE